MTEQTIQSKVPWYELDRMIIESLQSGTWEHTGYVVTTVMRQCMDRKLPVTQHEIVSRVAEMVKLGILALIGDLWDESLLRSAVCIVVAG